MSKKHRNPLTLPFNHPDKQHCPDAEVAKQITTGVWAPSPTIFQEEDKPFPFWLYQDSDPSGERVPLGDIQHGPVSLSIGDLLLINEDTIRITALVHWTGEDEYVVELSNGKTTTLEIAVCGRQAHDLTMFGDCEGRDTI